MGKKNKNKSGGKDMGKEIYSSAQSNSNETQPGPDVNEESTRSENESSENEANVNGVQSNEDDLPPDVNEATSVDETPVTQSKVNHTPSDANGAKFNMDDASSNANGAPSVNKETPETKVSDPVVPDAPVTGAAETTVTGAATTPILEVEPSASTETPSPSTPSASSKTKKRLTLQERLALAAKGNKKQPKPSSKTTPTADIKQVSSPGVESLASSPEPVAAVESFQPEPDHELQRLKALNAELSEENRRLKVPSSSSSFEKERKDLLAKLDTKEETIKQLLKEGESLSIKELKLNEVIKTLKTTNFELETIVKDYSSKNDESLIKINELEDFLRTHKFKSIEQLLESYTEMSRKVTNLENDIKREKNLNWQGKYKEQQRLYESELNDKKAALKSLNETKIQLDMYKSQTALDLNSKDTIISSLKKNITDLKEEFSQESARLESKLEFLRVANESSSYMKNDTTTSHENDKDSDQNRSDSKVIDYEEFAKLSQSHHNLQQQYVSSQENWKLIESNLLNKVDTLSSSVETLKKSKLKLTHDVKKLTNDLANETAEFDDLNESYSTLSKELKELEFQLKLKDDELQQSQEKFDKLKQIFNTDRQNLESKIKTLTESIERMKNDSFSNEDTSYTFSKSSNHLKKVNEAGLNINIDSPARLQFRSPSLESSGMNNFANSWAEIKLGESSTTPAVTKEFTGVFLNRSNNNSSNSFHDNNDDDISLQDDSFSFQSKHQSRLLPSGGSSYTISNSNLQSTNSISGMLPTSSGTSNIQLINKMSSNIRGLEIELNTLKEENSALAVEKDQAQQEILSKFELSNEIEALQNQIKDLESQLAEKSVKEQTMLELIGEKSEQVQELRADVEDLKDLCKQQVQQMIELQEAKSS